MGCREISSPSTCRRRSAGTDSRGKGLPPPPAEFPPYAVRCRHPPSVPEPSASARCRGAPKGNPYVYGPLSGAVPNRCCRSSSERRRLAPSRTASSAGGSPGLHQSPTGPAVAIGVHMEDRFQDGLQVALDDFLGDSIRDRRNPQRSGFRLAVALRDVDPSNRWGQVAPRGHSGPGLVEGVLEVSLEVCNRLSVYSSRPLVSLHLLEGLPDFLLRNI